MAAHKALCVLLAIMVATAATAEAGRLRRGVAQTLRPELLELREDDNGSESTATEGSSNAETGGTQESTSTKTTEDESGSSTNSSASSTSTPCPADCHGHGMCLDGKCICFAAWSGDDCGVTTCPSSCSGNGQCNQATGRCECFSGFLGVDCSQQGCASNCNNHGYCDKGVCQCLPGWEGVYCRDPEGCPNSCSGHGECRNQHCYCDSGYTGKGCDELECPKACSGNGECDTSSGQCTCLEGFLGADCSQKRCPNDCSGFGTCDTESGKCTCKDGYYGDDCAPENCPSDCSGHGHCTQSNITGLASCICERGWSGIGCEHELCPALCHEEDGQGKCTPTGCVCDAKWGDIDCSRRRCPYDCTASDHGICTSDDGSFQCNCFAEWTGDACEERTCPNNCNDRGSCNNGTCVCSDWWEGTLCELPKCKNDCSGNGECIKPQTTGGEAADLAEVLRDGTESQKLSAAIDHLPPGPIEYAKCRCNDGWRGEDCSEKACLNDCSGRGVCRSGQCYCQTGYYGADCTQVQAAPENPRNVTADELARADCSKQCLHGKCLFVSSVELKSLQTPNISATAQTIRAASGTFECFCEESWTGPWCTEPLTACHPSCLDEENICRKDCNTTLAACPTDDEGNACSNHGQCKRTENDVKCVCDPGWFRYDCSVRSCPNNCSNRGLCHGKTQQCLCYPGHTGVDCSEKA